jgi:hypothetical protein
MKNLELLKFLTQKQVEFIEAAELQYRRYARIYFKIVSFENDELIIKVWQTEKIDKNYLSGNDLIIRAKELFKGKIPDNVKLHVRPVPFDVLANFTLADIKSEMEKLDLQQKDLVKLLNINKTTISLLLSDSRNMTKATKAMFYYLFKYLNETVKVPA